MNKQTVYIVDDDEGVREALKLLLETVHQDYQTYASPVDFLASYDDQKTGCLVLDIRMPEMSGLILQKKLKELNSTLPIIFITGHGDIPMAVDAMREGALNFIRKPFREHELLDCINQALQMDAGNHAEQDEKQKCINLIATLTEREREIFNRVSNGDANKVISSDLGISQRTVEVHRSKLMKKLKVNNLAQLVRIKIQSESAL